jgi:Sec-independent protein translocase protein TatA
VGIELLIGVVLGFVVLGPRRMHSMLGPLGRAKAQFERASRELRFQMSTQLDRSTGSPQQKESFVPEDRG